LKTLNESFTDQEFAVMLASKAKLSERLKRKVNWHDYIFCFALDYLNMPEPMQGKPYGKSVLESIREEVKTK